MHLGGCPAMTGPGRRSLRRARSRVAELGLALVLCGLAGGAGAATRLTEVRVLDGPDATSLELTLEGLRLIARPRRD